MQRTFRNCYVFVIVLVTLAAIETGYAADKWVSVKSKNFLLVGNASESNIRRIGRNLEEFRAGFALLFPSIDKQAPPPITVVVFKDDASFRPYKPLYQGKPASLDGFFQSGSDVNFIALAADIRSTQVIYHEFVHALNKDNAVSLPLWAGEGLAEFYGMFEIDSNGKEMLLGRPLVEHIQTLRGSFMPVEALFSVGQDSTFYNEQSKQGIFYAESWAVMHYLILGENGKYRPQLARFLTLLASGKGVNDSYAEAFQRDYPAFERDLQNYISRFTFPVIKFKLNSKIDFEREMQVSPLSDAQVQYYLGDLLLHIGRLDTAETYLAKAASLDPKFAPSLASMGMLKMRQDQDEEALKFLTQAVQADSKDYMVHYYYAQMLQTVGEKADSTSRENSRFELMRTHLKKCIELAPGYLNAYDMLGYVSLKLQSELRETQNLLIKVLNSSPGRRQIRLRLAELMISNNEQQAARVILQPLKEGEDDAVREQARSLLGYIDKFLANRRALLEYEERRKEAEAAAAAAIDTVTTATIVSDSKRDEPLDGPPALTRNDGKRSSDGGVIETAKPRIVRPAGLEVEGVLVSADCSRGLTLRVRIGNGHVELHSPDPSKIEFISYTTAITDTFACGSFRSAPPVHIVYRRSTDPRYLGEPIRVEFIDKK